LEGLFVERQVRVLLRREEVLVRVMGGLLRILAPVMLVLVAVRGVSVEWTGVVVPVGGLVERLPVDADEVEDERSSERPIARRNRSFKAIVSSTTIFLLLCFPSA
jgi:hypothetical protein